MNKATHCLSVLPTLSPSGYAYDFTSLIIGVLLYHRHQNLSRHQAQKKEQEKEASTNLRSIPCILSKHAVSCSSYILPRTLSVTAFPTRPTGSFPTYSFAHFLPARLLGSPTLSTAPQLLSRFTPSPAPPLLCLPAA